MKWLKSLPVIIFFTSYCLYSAAQDTTRWRNLEQEFNAFKSSIEDEFKGQSRKNDSIFLTYLQENWKEYQLFVLERVKRVKPEQQPIAPKVIENLELPHSKTIDSVALYSEPALLPEVMNDRAFVVDPIGYFDFLGQKIGITKPTHSSYQSPAPGNDKKVRIFGFYQEYAKNESWQKITHQLSLISRAKLLNDWGFYYLVTTASEIVFNDPDEQLLFVWISLLKEGINARVAYNNDSIFLLATFGKRIYNSPFVNIAGQDFYLLSPQRGRHLRNIQSYNMNYPGPIRPLSIDLADLPKLALIPEYRKLIFLEDSMMIRINRSLIDFFSGYPDCDLALYFNTPLSLQAKTSLDALLLPLIAGKSEPDKVKVLLKFVQEAFPYKTDIEQFGKEKYLFPDETLHYPYTDCEDRAVLFAKLVYLYTGLSVVGLDYPGHVSVAVKLTKPIEGAYVIYKKEKYFVCDPTYIGAEPGMAMEGMKNVSPTIIVVNKEK